MIHNIRRFLVVKAQHLGMRGASILTTRARSVSRAAFMLCAVGALGIGGCAEVEFISHATKEIRGTTDEAPPGEGGNYKIGRPYQIDGVWYYPREDFEYTETGIASWYGPNFHGKQTANGDVFDQNEITAAHRTLPMPSMVRITNLDNGRSLTVLVNDRGPFARGRIIDVSRRTAQLLGFERQGTAKVRVEILADDSRRLALAAQGLNGGDASPKAAPSIAVTSQELEPPPSTDSSEPTSPQYAVAAVDAPPVTIETAGKDAPPEPDGKVTVVAVDQGTSVYIQAGAFSQYHNANRARAILSQLGPVRISQVKSDDVPLFRVRVGPIGSVADADRLLAQIAASGYPDARIIVTE